MGSLLDITSSPHLSTSALIGLCVALGIGLMIGAERERRKGEGADRAAAGIRTFATAALVGAVAMLLGGGIILATAVLCVGAFALLAYQRTCSNDPGITTEVALVLTTLLGGLAMREAILAAAVGAALALLLAARNRIHHFVSSVLTEQELHDALLFAAAVLILLPLAPDRYMGPFQAINPHALVLLIVLVMGINAAGYIAARLVGPRYGLPIAGLAGGFVSSTATIHAMGTRIRDAGEAGDKDAAGNRTDASSQNLSLVRAATAGAVFSSVATLVQMMLVLWMLQRELAMALMLPLSLGILVSVIYAAFFLRGALADGAAASDARATNATEAAEAVTSTDDTTADRKSHASHVSGRAFNPIAAASFTAIVAAMFVIVAALNAWLGERGVIVSAILSGFVDAHAAAASVAAAVTRSELSLPAAIVAVLAGTTSNAVMKIIVAYQSAGIAFAARIAPGLIAMIGVVWIAAWRSIK